MTVQARPWLDRIDPYRPGRHATSAHGSMASNESALGPSRSVVAAVVAAADAVNHYPDPLADDLRAELASLHDVHPDQILVGNGSDELIYLLAWAYLAQDGHAVCADPAYRIDEISTYVVGARLTKVPLRDHVHDLEAMAKVEADIAYVVNPHNPTGTTRSLADIEHFVRTSRSLLTVVDEAYIDFTDDPETATAMPLARDGRAAVLRTFSKVYGLAALRIGYLVAAPDVIAVLRKIRPPFSVGALAQADAVAAVRDRAYHQLVRERTIRSRKELVRIVEAAGYAAVPSQANFVLVEVPHEAEMVRHLAAHGISVRPGAALGVPGAVRISVPPEPGLYLLEQALDPTNASAPANVGAGTD